EGDDGEHRDDGEGRPACPTRSPTVRGRAAVGGWGRGGRSVGGNWCTHSTNLLTAHFGVTPSNGASCVAIGFRLSLSGSFFGLKSQGWIVFGSAKTMRFALRTPVTLPCGTSHEAFVLNGK